LDYSKDDSDPSAISESTSLAPSVFIRQACIYQRALSCTISSYGLVYTIHSRRTKNVEGGLKLKYLRGRTIKEIDIVAAIVMMKKS
jgi:hypothetical protein